MTIKAKIMKNIIESLRIKNIPLVIILTKGGRKYESVRYYDERYGNCRY